jgi:hypothetical protein
MRSNHALAIHLSTPRPLPIMVMLWLSISCYPPPHNGSIHATVQTVPAPSASKCTFPSRYGLRISQAIPLLVGSCHPRPALDCSAHLAFEPESFG